MKRGKAIALALIGIAGSVLLAILRGDERPRAALGTRAQFVRDVASAFAAAGASAVMIPLLVTHSALATGYGRNVHANNIGVLRAGPGYEGATVDLATREWRGDHYEASVARWRAYPSLEASAADLLALLRSPRYALALNALEAGHREWFAELGHAGFYTEPVERHFPRYLSVLQAVQPMLEGR